MAGLRTQTAFKHLKDEIENAKNNNRDIQLSIDDAELIKYYIDDINDVNFEDVIDKLNSIKYDIEDITDDLEDLM